MNDLATPDRFDPEPWWNQLRSVVGTKIIDSATLETLGVRWLDAVGRFGLQPYHLRLIVLKVTSPTVLARIRGYWDLLAEWSAATQWLADRVEGEREQVRSKELYGAPLAQLPAGVTSLFEVFTRGNQAQAEEEARAGEKAGREEGQPEGKGKARRRK